MKSKLIVIVPGVMGSELNIGSTKIWPKFFPTNIGHYEKYLPVGKYNIKPAGIIENVYAKLYKFTERMEGYQIEVFSYDWRISNIENAERLNEFLLLKYINMEEIILIAHSMGGIISKILLTKYNEADYIPRINKLITMGTPWLGSLESYKTLKYGSGIPYDKFPIVLTASVARDLSKGFPSVYQLLPQEKYYKRVKEIHNVSTFSVNGNEMNDTISFFNSEIKGFFYEEISNSDEGLFQETYKELFEKYYEILNKDIVGIQHHEIIGIGHLTLSAIKRNNLDEVSGYFKNGDGTVPIFSASSNTEHKYYINGVGHQKLPKNEHVHKVIENIIRGQSVVESEDVFLNEQRIKDIGFRGKIIRIACPVQVSVLKDGKSIYGYSDDLGYDAVEELINSDFEVINLGDTTYLLLEEETSGEKRLNSNRGEEKIVIEAYGEGPTTISMEEFDKGAVVRNVSFETFNINIDMVAEVSLDKEITNSTLTVFEKGGVKKVEAPVIQETDKEVNLPETVFEIKYEFGYKQDNYIICSGGVQLVIEEVLKGSYDVKETFVKLNGRDIKLLDQNMSLVLEKGDNQLEVFSIDMYGNVENPIDLKLFYVEELRPNIYMEILPHQYTIHVNHDEVYQELKRRFNIEEPNIQIVSKIDKEKVFITDKKITVINHEPEQRKINIIYKSVLGESNEELNIEGYAIRSIFEGVGNTENFKEFLKQLKIQSPYDVKIFKIEGQGTYRKLTDKNISNGRRILITTENKKIELIKSNDFIVSFHSLTEDIKIEESKQYSFSFKVFDSSNKEIRTLELSAFVKIKLADEDRITPDIAIQFNQEHDVYNGKVRIEQIEEILNEYWDKTPIHSAEIVIIKNSNGNIIRTTAIKIRK